MNTESMEREELAPEEPIEGQVVLPGFESQEEQEAQEAFPWLKDDKTIRAMILDLFSADGDDGEHIGIADVSVSATLSEVVKTQPLKEILYPTDKLNAEIWRQAPDEEGRITLAIGTNNSNEAAVVRAELVFDRLLSEAGLEIKAWRKITPEDKLYYIVISSLYYAGNHTTSLSQIFKAMGHSTAPMGTTEGGEKSILERINDSVTLFGTGRVYIDNDEEIDINKRTPRLKMDAALLNFTRVSAYIDGAFTDAAIHINEEPILMRYARLRKQFTAISPALLKAPVNKTPATLDIQDYLITRIARMKNPNNKAPRKILYRTVFERCGITDKKQRTRAKGYIDRFLQHYKNEGHIAGFTKAEDGAIIRLPKEDTGPKKPVKRGKTNA